MATYYNHKRAGVIWGHGRKYGVDHKGYIVAQTGVRDPLELSTGTEALRTHGISVLSGTTATWTLGAPPALGATKTIINGSSLSTATLSIVRSSSSSGVTFGGSTANGGGGVRINLLNNGSGITLIGVSTVAWMPLTMQSSLFQTVSTSS
jgi:hypothetical protein